ncbi:hypothetical protein AXF42_Ash004871 [Apostasia shenzhenica]|uniref:Uncharacterized protein n=1 Tax=Apostasia shenzhenica TaxID=1088818 RepID=A0A2I0B7Y2_9ASPA|nr:hypothetical protein AXF42_Ash004871 [Apostasia shenzhenica]
MLLFENHHDLLEEVSRFRPPDMERRICSRCSLCWLLFPSFVVAVSLYLTCEKPLSCLLMNNS